MTFEESLDKYLSRLRKTEPQLADLTEESTKTALIMPFFALLGYDVFNTQEFVPEYTCDVATKKGEKIDYAVLKDGEPTMLIEAKRAGMKLQKQQQGQLFRYFSTNRCRIAILTNGITYQFFSDLNAPNVMDEEAFLTINLLEDDPALYRSSIKQFSKDKFNVKDVIAKAVYQKYSKVVQKTLKEDLIEPSDELVKYFLTRPEIKTAGRITSQMIDRYREQTSRAMQKVFGAVIVQKPAEPAAPEQTPQPEEIGAEKQDEPDIENMINDIESCISESYPGYTFQVEERSDCARVHVFMADGQKVGALKINKGDFSMQFRAIISGIVETHDIDTIDDILNYIN